MPKQFNKLVTPDKASVANLPSAGAERLKADYRMFGGLLLVLGLCAAYGSFADLVSLAGKTSSHSSLLKANLVGALMQTFLGLVCMAVGFMAVVMDKGSKTATTFAVVAIQLAWFPFLVGLVELAKGIFSNPFSNPFIHPGYEPSPADIKFMGAMSVFGLFAYGLGFIGSMSFMAFSMRAIQAGKPEDRSGLYYRGRSRFYNGLLLLAGFSQFTIGCFIINTYGNGPLEHAPIEAGIFGVIYFPEISVFVGFLQIITSVIGLLRSLEVSLAQKDSVYFQLLSFFMYLCMISLQVLSQVAYAPSGTGAALAPTLGCFYFGLALMPAFLDWKMNNVPENLQGYYKAVETEAKDGKLSVDDVIFFSKDDEHSSEIVELENDLV